MPSDWEYSHLGEEDFPILIKQKAVFGKQQILEHNELKNFTIYVFMGDEAKSKEKPMVESKLLKNLGASVRKSANKSVNLIVVPDYVFDLSYKDLVKKNDFKGNCTEIPLKTNNGKGFSNMFEFLFFDQWNIVSWSDMGGIIDKLESAVSVEWHMVRGFSVSKKKLKETNRFAMAVTPFLGHDENDMREGDNKPFMIKFLHDEQRYVVQGLDLDAPSGTSIFTTSIERS